jgi:hypothetical protein
MPLPAKRMLLLALILSERPAGLHLPNLAFHIQGRPSGK